MPILWRRIAWFGSFAVAVALAWWMRSQDFDWPATISAAVATYIALPFIISQLSAALVLRHAKRTASEHVKYVEKLTADAPKILRDYAKLNEDFPGCVIDISRLPAGKATMKDVIQFSWLTEKFRNWLETGWLLLSWFQPGVGQIPINILTKSSKIPPKQLGQYTTEQQRWLNLIFAETEVLEREFARFKQTRPAQARRAPSPRL
jgi:hypothetical protein